jgi:hypothetical protein
LGGGGGGATYNGNVAGGDGGNGVVIVRIATARYSSASLTGTYSTAVDGTDTIITWTATGTLVT